MTTSTPTNTTPLSTVIGVFADHEQADRAIDELRHSRFSYERIRVVERGMGGFGDTLKSLFTGQAAMASNTADNLVKMGMPEYEAQYYQRELDANHVLVLMNADDRPEDAFTVMRQNGAFDINSRLRMPLDESEMQNTNGTRTAENTQEAEEVRETERMNEQPETSNTPETERDSDELDAPPMTSEADVTPVPSDANRYKESHFASAKEDRS
jgi:hypothetical protein